MAKKSVARSLGKALAYIQDTIDIVARYAFHKLRSVQFEEQQREPSPRKEVKKVTSGILHFFGELGDTFYQEYEKLKKGREN